MAKVLLVGYRHHLLREREARFSSEGFEVIPARDLWQALQACKQDCFDAVVLGQSVPEEERNQIARAARQKNRRTKLLMLYIGSIQNAELGDALLHGTATAEEICRTVNYLLDGGAESQVV